MRKGLTFSALMVIVLLLFGLLPLSAVAEPAGPFYTVESLSTAVGAQLERATIAGPATPPAGFELERASVSAPAPDAATATLNVPAYDWVYGCSAVSASMIAAYYDQNGLPDIYTGPTNGGVMPMDSSVWPRWTDVAGASYPSNPLIASMIGLEGRVARGSIEDYWIEYNSSAADPFIAGNWTQHAYSDAIGDYMKTSQSTYDNVDGATSFWNYNSAAPLPCADMPGLGIADDGTYGRMQFYQARGYAVSECFNQKTDNVIAGGFTFSQYKQRIDAGKPVLINLAGHSVVGMGYADPATVYLHDTWDYGTHEMAWGGSYAGMAMQSVSIATPGAAVVAPAASINDVTVTEGNSGAVNAVFTVSLSAPAPSAITIAWATENGTATDGTDYTAASGTVSFAPGESAKPVTMQVKGDTTYEPDETFYVNLSSPSGATINDGQGVGTINNDDAAPKMAHVGDLDATRAPGSKSWSVTVTITVHDASEKLMGSASVSGSWSGGATGSGSCTTRSGTGVCSIKKSVPNTATSETFTVTKITLKGYTYDATKNHDPDGDSTGTVITVSKP